MISFDDFKKVELTVGKILSAEKVPETDKLLKLSVDFGLKQSENTDCSPLGRPDAGLAEHSLWANVLGEGDIRQIISGIAACFPNSQELVGRKFMFVTNIPPRSVKGLESNGMILALATEDGKFSLLEPNVEIPEGTRAR